MAHFAQYIGNVKGCSDIRLKMYYILEQRCIRLQNNDEDF